MMTSGMTRGAAIRPVKSSLPLNLPMFGRAKPARTEEGCHRRADKGDTQAKQGSVDNLLVIEEFDVPPEGKPVPDTHDLRIVERMNDHHEDRDIEKGIAEQQAGNQED